MSVRAPVVVDGGAPPHSTLTRLLHLGIAASIIHQLVVSLIMETPTATTPGDLAWQAHQIVGLTSLGLLFVFWAWTLVRASETSVGRLWPWFSAERRRAVLRDVRDQFRLVRKGALPPPGNRPMASAIHGLGLVIASVMALTGATYLLPGVPPNLLGAALGVHGAVANLMWAYLIAHAGIVLLHEVAGHSLLRGMFLPPQPNRSGERA